MREDETPEQDEPGEDLNEFAIRNVSEFFYAGRPAVVVRTTRLDGSDDGGEDGEDAVQPRLPKIE
jgi:hypothetical protein